MIGRFLNTTQRRRKSYNNSTKNIEHYEAFWGNQQKIRSNYCCDY